jgi:hypothetical protein
MDGSKIIGNSVKTLLLSYLKIFLDPDLKDKIGFAMYRLPNEYFVHAKSIKVFENVPAAPNSLYFIPKIKPMKIKRMPKQNVLELKKARAICKENISDTNSCESIPIEFKFQLIKIYIVASEEDSDTLEIFEDHATEAKLQITNMMNMCKYMLRELKFKYPELSTIDFIGDLELKLVDTRLPNYEHPTKIIFKIENHSQ